MNSEKILVTGCAGFIGMHLCKSLLNDGYEILGIDNMNDYYSPLLKNARLNELKNYDNFAFKKVDLTDKISLTSIFQSFKPAKVVNLAAQVGVRYSLENPDVYADSNIIGFLYLLECCKTYETTGLIYASSSSVYGNQSAVPFDEKDFINNPISIYAVSKLSNELMAKVYSHLYGIRTTGLRFFTVYGPWGRPDMAVYSFTDKISKGISIDVYNHGRMKRDFTYVDDIIRGVVAALENNYSSEIFNLGNNRCEKLMDVIHIIEQHVGKKANINFKPIHPGDVKITYAGIKHASEKLNFNPQINIANGIASFVEWYNGWHN